MTKGSLINEERLIGKLLEKLEISNEEWLDKKGLAEVFPFFTEDRLKTLKKNNKPLPSQFVCGTRLYPKHRISRLISEGYFKISKE